MTSREAVNWIINISADIGKREYKDLWHYEQALSEIKEMLESLPDIPDINDEEMISRRAAIDIGRDLIIPMNGYHMYNQGINNYCTELTNLPAAQQDTRKGKRCVTENSLIKHRDAIDAVNGLIDRFERILRDIRESKVDESVCGMCEYDGTYMGQSGNWCNECPGFEKDDCFKLSEECKKRWFDSVKLPSAQPEPKTGHWIPVTNGRGGHECSQCHEYAPSWATGKEHLTNFCPSCGVRCKR